MFDPNGIIRVGPEIDPTAIGLQPGGYSVDQYNRDFGVSTWGSFQNQGNNFNLNFRVDQGVTSPNRAGQFIFGDPSGVIDPAGALFTNHNSSWNVLPDTAFDFNAASSPFGTNFGSDAQSSFLLALAFLAISQRDNPHSNSASTAEPEDTSSDTTPANPDNTEPNNTPVNDSPTSDTSTETTGPSEIPNSKAPDTDPNHDDIGPNGAASKTERIDFILANFAALSAADGEANVLQMSDVKAVLDDPNATATAKRAAELIQNDPSLLKIADYSHNYTNSASHDNRVIINEVQTARNLIADKPNVEKAIGYLQTNFTSVDRNGDGFITRSELEKLNTESDPAKKEIYDLLNKTYGETHYLGRLQNVLTNATGITSDQDNPEDITISRQGLQNLAQAIGSTVSGPALSPLSKPLDQLLAEGWNNRDTNPAGAEVALREILRVNPEHEAAQHILGVVLRNTGRVEESIPFLRNAVRLAVAAGHPNAQANVNLGLAYGLSGDVGRARYHYLEAIKIDANTLDQVRILPGFQGT